MVEIVYKVVEHDGGWAYRVGDVYSETYPTEAEATAAAGDAARRQEVTGPAESISYQDESSAWHEERAPGSDRPDTDVESELSLHIAQQTALRRV